MYLRWIKKIIGYKAPHDLFKGRIKAGSIFSVKRKEEFVWYNPEHLTSGVPTEIVEKWEPVYEKLLKIVKMRSNSGEFELEVSKDKVYYRPDDAELNISDIRELVSLYNDQRLTKLRCQRGGYDIKNLRVDVGCRKGTYMSDWKNVLNVLESFNN